MHFWIYSCLQQAAYYEQKERDFALENGTSTGEIVIFLSRFEISL